ncbi:flagellin [Actinoplanes sp. SE50]|uniref:flagellin N-terminal helical domain-containing protein n=1 Tax=unclassified Actinoplanes TaxID=2626549 RepID=UPI00023EDEBD|nr:MULTISPECIES: flagellin [unclassified Actinoplanes]AEV88777.1 Flagellin A [Actinoplanes sp. SE50/110]ATO87183.1 flagellin [Actinoplanes sp. SE50]SLM04601.1 Flagellin A [Actinoplanes sp. SE50/110]
MGLRINQNIAAQNAYRNLSVTDNQMQKSLEKLSSGFRINRAADDAAGLSISEGLRAQTGGLKVATRNAQDAISVVQTAEGALNETTSMLQRMRDLSVQASNASLDSDAKQAAQDEFSQLSSEIDRVSTTTAFGKSKLLDGSFGNTNHLVTTTPAVMPAGGTAMTLSIDTVGGTTLNTPIAASFTTAATGTASTPQDVADNINTQLQTALKANGRDPNEISVTAKADETGKVTFEVNSSSTFNVTASNLVTAGASQTNASAASGDFQIGANSGEKLGVHINEVSSKSLGLNNLNLTTAAVGTTPSGASQAIDAVDKAIKSVSATRAQLGAHQNRFEHTINNLNVAVENLSASESRIRDTDMAQEMVSFTRNQILTQAGTSMLSQANQSAQNVLSLLR